jgi:pantoate--beta-alanine ligase
VSPAALLKVSSVPALRKQVAVWRSRKQEIVFVPTMGALHRGHRSLIERAGGTGRRVVVSIFVNPTQFGPGEDFSAYPRNLRADLDLCREAGAHLVFVPRVETLYPAGFATNIHVAGLDTTLCAPHRPGHFDGVCTIVLKLLNIVAPDRLILGKKDAQQAVGIGRRIRDLDVPVQLDVAPTVRERDGLALSSRNQYLSPEERNAAPKLYAALDAARRRIRSGERDAGKLIAAIEAHLDGEPLFRRQYVEIVDAANLERVAGILGRVLVAAAVHVGRARLIDNVVVSVPVGRSAGVVRK